MYQIANEPAPDVRTLRPELPQELADILSKALTKSPEQRYQTGEELAAELRKVLALAAALEVPDKAVGTDEANTSALLMKAGVLNRQERFNEALACYERALEVHRSS